MARLPMDIVHIAYFEAFRSSQQVRKRDLWCLRGDFRKSPREEAVNQSQIAAFVYSEEIAETVQLAFGVCLYR